MVGVGQRVQESVRTGAGGSPEKRRVTTVQFREKAARPGEYDQMLAEAMEIRESQGVFTSRADY